MKRWTPTLIVLGVFVALAAFVLLYEAKRPSPPDAQATPTPLPLLNLTLADVQSLRLSDGSRIVQLERQGETWVFTQPEPRPADPYRVQIEAGGLLSLQARRIVQEQPLDLTPFGLNPPALTLDILTLTGEAKQVRIGRLTPDTLNYYAQMQSDTRLYLVAQYTLQPCFTWMQSPPYLTESTGQ